VAHESLARVCALLTLSTCAAAVLLAVGLYGITREDDPNLAIVGLSFRIGEGVLNAVSAVVGLALVLVASRASTDRASVTLGAMILESQVWIYPVGASVFAMGSTAFCSVLLRARTIPVWLAWLGVAGSALLLIALPLQILAVTHRPVTDIVWV